MKGSITRRNGKRSGVSWLLKYDASRDPLTNERRQRYKTLKGGTRNDAERELRKLLSQVDDGSHVDPSKLTLSAWVETWLSDHAAPTVSHKTLERYGELLRLHMVPRLGTVAVQRLTTPAIQGAYADLLTSGRRQARKADGDNAPAAPRGLAPRTVLHAHRVLFQCLAAAVRQRVIVRNPAADVTPPNPRRSRVDAEDGTEAPAVIRALDGEQLDALLKGLKPSPLFALAAVAAGTGMRRGEILALRWSDVDLEARTVRVERSIEDTKAKGVRVKPCPKNDSSRRTIGIDEGLAALLRSLWTGQAQDALKLGLRLSAGALLFPRSPLEPTAPRRPRDVTKQFGRLASGVGFGGFRLHDLRHTHATLLLLAGVPVNAVASRLGHSSPVTTMTVYAHVLRRAEDRAAEVAGGLLRAALAD